MLAITENQLTFSLPNFSVSSPLQKNKRLASAKGTFHGLEFSVSPEDLIVDGFPIEDDISSTEPFTLARDDLRFSFYTDKSVVKDDDGTFFSLTIKQGEQEFSVCPGEIYFRSRFENKIFVYPTGSDFVPTQLTEINLCSVKCNALPVETYHNYEVSSYLNEDNSLQKTVKKWDSHFRESSSTDLSEEQLKQLTLDRFGFEELQITLE
jgi:hypothetical protein